MIALIMSDSHGHTEPMCKAVERTQPDVILHLGDGYRDVQSLQRLYPYIPVHQVRGNCDIVPEAPRELLISLEGHSVFLCHGDRYGVKTSLRGIGELLEGIDAEVVFFGHTHSPLIDHRQGAMLVNPGSIGLPARPGAFSYAVALFEEGKKVNCWLHVLQGTPRHKIP